MEQSYKEKYEDILARLERAKNDNEVCDERFCCVINEIIPELAESEDEKVRKWIINEIKIKHHNLDEENVDLVDKAIAWLEKQGQVKESFISQHENRTCEENGNSLTYEDERIRKEIINYFQCQSEEEPTRKEIHDKWIAWLENIPYTIDHEKREGFHLGYKACLEKQGEQKPEENKGNIGGISANWSEEDEQHIDSLLKRLDALCRNKFERTRFAISEDRDWLKSLRPQNTWKPSEDDIIILEKLIKGELEPKVFQATLQGILEQLKKLKEG